MSVPERRREPGEVVFGYLLLGFSLFVFSEAYKISGFSSWSGAGVFPLGAATVMVLSSLVIIAKNHRMPKPAEGQTIAAEFRWRILPTDILVFVGLLVAYTLALDALGFLLSSFLFLLASILHLYRGNVLLVLLVSAGSLAAIYVLFRIVFTVTLPQGWLFR
jgi:hypothetical protein